MHATVADNNNNRGSAGQQEPRMAARTHKLFCANLDYEVLVPRSAATGDATTRE
jgi:hypothetical protein